MHRARPVQDTRPRSAEGKVTVRIRERQPRCRRRDRGASLPDGVPHGRVGNGSAAWEAHVTPRGKMIDRTRSVLEVDWPLFGELSRALALKVARTYDPEIVVGIATAGVIPGAVIAAILGREFHSIVVSRRYGADTVRATPAILGVAPPEVRNRRVLLVDETCDTGETLRLAVAAIVNAGAADVRTAVGFRTGPYVPDFSALDTENEIILPWDREIVVPGSEP